MLMGCICSKGVSEDENTDDEKDKGLAKSLSRLFTPSKKEEFVAPDSSANSRSNGDRSGSMSMPQESVVAPVPVSSDEMEKKAVVAYNRTGSMAGHQRRATVDVGANGAGPNSRGFNTENNVDANLGIVGVPNGFEGEHVAAGWPSWLASVAAEAVKGWLPRRADSFEKLDKIGQGTYSSVYRARDLETGKIVALKKVRFVNMDPESVRFMAREIHILRRLDHPNVVKLEGLVTSRMSCNLYLVFEYMEHDLAGLTALSGNKFTEPQVKCYMQQLLRGLDHCHSRGVLHRDIKGSNLLVDNNGILRIGDFGLATLFHSDQKQPLTSCVVTLWYRPPELLLGATEYGVAVDLWSAGCILAELLAGKPVMPGRTEVEQLHKIFKLCGSPSEEYWRKSKLQHSTIFKPQNQYPRRVSETFRDFPSSALALLDSLLAIEPADRGTAASALQSEFFTSKPLACDPSSLPKHPPCKEYDAKLRDEEARRQKAAAIKGKGSESVRGSRESRAMPVRNANAELKKRQVQANRPCGTGFPIDPPGTAAYGYSHTGTSMHPAYGSSWNNKAGGDLGMIPGRSASTLRVPNGPQLRTQRSYLPQPAGSELFNLQASRKKDEIIGVKESTMGYGGKNKRIHYSGPLMPPGENIEDMLKEHERQIQQAVRKARLDKTKTKKNF